MKKLKKITALTTSLLLCIALSIPLAVNADHVSFGSGTDIFEPCPEVSEYLDGVVVYKSVDPLEYGYYFAYASNYPTSVIFSTLNFAPYVYHVTDEEVSALTDYISEIYPGATLTKESGDAYLLDYNCDVTFEEQLQLAVDIKRDFGLLCEHGYCEDILGTLDRGDTNNDGTINAVDASLILTYYAEVQTGGSSQRASADEMSMSLLGDYNNDGVVNAVDASAVLTFYAKEQTS
mgnify:CR=1 FL=1